jgi:hypothetical protein
MLAVVLTKCTASSS